MAKKKDIIQKEIIFPCGDKLVVTSDYGHAYGLVVAHEPVDGEGDKESKHLYGIEFMENRKNRCPHCGRHLKYTEERRS